MLRFLCGVPNDQCCGAITQTNASIRNRSRAHATRQDAFKCHEKWLIAQGYKKVGMREFAPPAGVDEGYITLLSKKSKFGGILRPGKSGVKAMGSGNRFMPKHLGKRPLSGMVLST